MDRKTTKRDDELRTDAVTDMYEQSFPLHERRWSQEGHRSYHHGYYESADDDPARAVERMCEVVADAVAIESGDRVLDLGCGVGSDTLWLAETYDVSVVGVNVHDRQLERARSHAAATESADRISFRFDDFHELESVDSGSVDVVWGVEALCHSRDDDAVVDASSRVLDGGGRIVFADLFRRSEIEDQQVASRFEKLYDAWDVRYDPIDELTTALSNAGFENVTVRDISDAVRPSIDEAGRMSLYGYPYYKLLSLLGRVDDRLVGLAIGGYHCQKLFGDHLGYYVVSGER
ncbi:SAM-dependent methyltransferase [Halovivax gelatinilyticus]|uniref:SAM-dependent methyltransferase n=1 Tax=Halovivax gelatinilyticus TaxID=2961597 RepID=UPI0020CA6BAC|nr:methyltransferase domain-containing protein [Halovivax gelatinilyticus]